MLSEKDKILYLFKKYLFEELTPKEKADLFAYASKEEWQDEFRRLINEAWSTIQATDSISDDKVREMLSGILTPVLSNDGATIRKIHNYYTWYKIAAVVAGIILCTYFLFNFFDKNDKQGKEQIVAADILPGNSGAILTLSDGREVTLGTKENTIITDERNGTEATLNDGELSYRIPNTISGEIAMHTVSTPRGKQFQLILPDGTHVWLNSASSISYPTAFTKSARKVSITGEVYFEVTKQSNKSTFQVNSSGQEITVLGTHFNINSYNIKDVRTTLLEGSVRIKSKGLGNEKVLEPGQQAIVADRGIEIRRANIDQVMAWKEGYFDFTDTEFVDIMQQLARWYNVEIKYAGKIPAVEFEGKLNRQVNLSRVLEFFRESGIRTRLENKTLIIL